MLSLFPEFLNYSLLAPVIMRLVLALIFLGSGYSKLFKVFSKTVDFFKKQKIKPAKFWVVVTGLIELACGAMFLLGFLTQLAAIIVALMMLVAIIKIKRRQGFLGGYDYEVLILICALSLLILGAGAFAIDLPL